MNRPSFTERLANSRVLLIYPLLLAAVPALHLAAENAHDIDSRSTMIALFASVALATLIFCVLLLICRKGRHVAAMTGWVMLLFFTFGRIFDLLWEAMELTQIRQLLYPLYAVYAALALAGITWLWRTRLQLKSFTQFAALTTAILFAVCTRNFVHEYKHYCKDQREIAEQEAEKDRRKAAKKRQKEMTLERDSSADAPNSGVQLASFETLAPDSKAEAVSSDQLPDIYYIILDGYARADILQELFDYDNSSFINSLRDRGFYVADESHANYAMTILSLPSALNMRYLTPEFERYGWKYTNYDPMVRLTSKNKVAATLKDRGYRVVHFATSWRATHSSDYADVTYTLEPEFLQREFMGLFLRTTAFRPLAPTAADTHELMFEKLCDVPNDPAPTFAFAHFILPHHPYVFDAHGNRRSDVSPELNFEREKGEANPWQDKKSYTDQLAYASTRIRDTIDEIMAKSERPPIIILQSDHGSASLRSRETVARQQPFFVRERISILNAYFVPKTWQKDLYPQITPVNSFRFVFNHLFGDSYEMLPDKLYFSWYAWPFNAQEITQQIEELDEAVRSGRASPTNQ
ncbi:MAG: LTA synthase family protein [Pirellulales bacterium]|nr:LTA synthase family protein [Pirellulales bacterium]